jgi:hypothetical protein
VVVAAVAGRAVRAAVVGGAVVTGRVSRPVVGAPVRRGSGGEGGECRDGQRRGDLPGVSHLFLPGIWSEVVYWIKMIK